MDKKQKKELKNKGKALVREASADVHQKLHARNPFPISDPRWAQNLKEEYYKNRKYRLNKTEVLTESEVLKEAYIDAIDVDISTGMVPMPDWYLLCLRCRDLLPTDTKCNMACSCGSLILLPTDKIMQLPEKTAYQIVKLIGRGSITLDSQKPKPWWKFW